MQGLAHALFWDLRICKIGQMSSLFVVSTQESNIATARAGTAKHLVISNHFALIEDFLSADAAVHSNASPGDQLLEIDEQFNLARRKQFRRGHDLIRLKLGSPAIRCDGCVI